MADKPRRRWPGHSSSDDGLQDSPPWKYEAPDPAVFGSLDDGRGYDQQGSDRQYSRDDRDGPAGSDLETGRLSRRSRRSSLGVGKGFFVACLLFGVAFLGSGLWIRAGTRPYGDGIIVTGEVVTVEASSSGDNGTTYSPVVEFIDPTTGAVHTATRQISSSSRPRLGDQWEVSFRPGEPEGGRVLGRWDWVFWSVFVTIGVVVLAITMSVGFVSLRRRRRR